MKDEQIEHWKKIVKTQEELKDLLNKVRFCSVMMNRKLALSSSNGKMFQNKPEQ